MAALLVPSVTLQTLARPDVWRACLAADSATHTCRSPDVWRVEGLASTFNSPLTPLEVVDSPSFTQQAFANRAAQAWEACLHLHAWLMREEAYAGGYRPAGERRPTHEVKFPDHIAAMAGMDDSGSGKRSPAPAKEPKPGTSPDPARRAA
jgi:hypothetical protein